MQRGNRHILHKFVHDTTQITVVHFFANSVQYSYLVFVFCLLCLFFPIIHFLYSAYLVFYSVYLSVTEGFSLITEDVRFPATRDAPT